MNRRCFMGSSLLGLIAPRALDDFPEVPVARIAAGVPLGPVLCRAELPGRGSGVTASRQALEAMHCGRAARDGIGVAAPIHEAQDRARHATSPPLVSAHADLTLSGASAPSWERFRWRGHWHGGYAMEPGGRSAPLASSVSCGPRRIPPHVALRRRRASRVLTSGRPVPESVAMPKTLESVESWRLRDCMRLHASHPSELIAVVISLRAFSPYAAMSASDANVSAYAPTSLGCVSVRYPDTNSTLTWALS